MNELSTLLHSGFDPTELPEAPLRVEVTVGPDLGLALIVDGTEPGPILIGTSPACSLRLTDRTVSRRHATLGLERTRVLVTDLSSRNGTFVDGVRILGAHVLPGQTMTLGGTTLTLSEAVPVRRGQLSSAVRFGQLLGASTEMRRLYPLCQRLAASNIPIIIEGETGTGKELLAESLHEEGPRRDGPFVVFDCTTVPPALMESELFGHERGAFTSATSSRDGVFVRAHGGTLLIDEIGDLALPLQAKLLRAVDRSEVTPLGGGHAKRVDVRLLAATRRNLDNEVQAGRFRDDLYHRLAVGRIELPPLRERKGDVLVLARHFLQAMGAAEQSLPPELAARWQAHDYPGNVRELHNTVARYLALGDLADSPRPRSLDPPARRDASIREIVELDLPLREARELAVSSFLTQYVERSLRKHGSVEQAAAASGVGRRYFQMLHARIRDSSS
jgi:DNA-binding NtrC family response regulator